MSNNISLNNLAPSDVCLVNMPFFAVERPSIALGILKSILKNANISSSVIYANLFFAEKMGFDVYNRISRFPAEYIDIQDWLFAGHAFPGHPPDDEAYFSTVMPQILKFCARTIPCAINKLNAAAIQNELLAIRDMAGNFIDELSKNILEANPKIVG